MMETAGELKSPEIWGVLGHLVGDALGVPYEFTLAKDIPPLDQIEYDPPAGFQRAYPKVPSGTWSDDGAQMLCVLDAVMDPDPNKYFADEVAQRLLRWRDKGFMAVDGIVFDIGNTTNKALTKLAQGVPSDQSGALGPKTLANGSLMRALTVAFIKADDDTIARAAMTQSKVTHAEVEPMLCCALYCMWAKAIMKGEDNPWQAACNAMYRVIPNRLFPFMVQIQRWPGPASGTGYCLDTIHSVKYAMEKGTDYESVVKLAIQLGNDTDTTACIAGGLAGLKYQHIPDRWLDGLRGRDILDPLLERMVSP